MSRAGREKKKGGERGGKNPDAESAECPHCLSFFSRKRGKGEGGKEASDGHGQCAIYVDPPLSIKEKGKRGRRGGKASMLDRASAVLASHTLSLLEEKREREKGGGAR